MLTALVLLSCLTTGAHAQVFSTAFSYQGELRVQGQAASGLYDLQLTAYAGPASTMALGAPVLIEDLSITDGLFSTSVDFGNSVFLGDPVYLQVAIRPGASTGSFQTLSPRQPILATPYALKVRAGSVTDIELASGSVGSQALVDGVITAVKIAPGAVGSAALGSNSVNTAHLADSSVTSSKLAMNSVDNLALQPGQVFGSKLADSAVTTPKIADASVTAAKIAAGAVGTVQLTDGAVVGAKIANLAVDTAAIANNAVTSTKLANGAVGRKALAAGAVGAALRQCPCAASSRMDPPSATALRESQTPAAVSAPTRLSPGAPTGAC
jgi:hypothetical protein